MRPARNFFSAIFPTVILAASCGGCAVPNWDVPRDEYNQPTVKTIIERIQCEIRDMVRDDRPDDPASFHRKFLLNGDYEVLIALSLEVNDSGGLAPSTTYATPITPPGSTFTFAANANLGQARAHTFTENVEISTRQIYLDWKSRLKSYDCPLQDHYLSGTLGIKDLVSMAASSPGLDESQKTVFGGSIQFVITKSLSATGPSWQIVRFKNIATLASLSEINTDKITLSFAQGSNKGKRLPRIYGVNRAAYEFLQQQLLNSISSQLILQNAQIR
ncbi:hypothetical protein JQ628_19635 [Bradyrhizobium lablabi]|uniref:hypothetical protein n=1 Tax=Bradyrhizobium lablabi TaxID=722472 RepID=UPI001BAD0031|nr:hypothetical protein [Bradyrhizobium lablabi]MBR1123748.1 hypothetical protein [Bradyrhizobium lablabi]